MSLMDSTLAKLLLSDQVENMGDDEDKNEGEEGVDG